MAKLTPYGGAGTATGANFLLEIADKKILIDCGMEQGFGGDEHNKSEFGYEPAKIDFLFVTHAHIDHIGLIPKLFKDGFRGEIYSTLETKEIAVFLLADAAKISGTEEALYSYDDISGAMSLWKGLKYHDKNEFGGFSVELYNAGHILGSAMVKISTSKGSMLFSGDIGNSPSILMPDVERVEGIDYLLIESVYGDRNHEHKEEREEKFKRIVKEAIERGGSLLIPAFSLERTQIMLYELNELFNKKEIPRVPVYLDSPLAIKITKIYERVKNLYNSDRTADMKTDSNIFKFKELIETANVKDSHEIAHIPGPKIIIAGSGMSTAGRIVGHEETFLPDPKSTLMLVGYQAVGTLGRQLEEGMKKVVIEGNKVAVNAKVEIIHGFSAHADSNALVKFVEPNAKSLKKVFVAMGETHSEIFLTQRLRDELEVDAVVAELGKSYEIEL